MGSFSHVGLVNFQARTCDSNTGTVDALYIFSCYSHFKTSAKNIYNLKINDT